MIRGRTGWTTAIAACMLACARGTGAQQPAPANERSTLAGVYTEAQAAIGEEAYALMCRSCHTPADHSATIKSKWSGRPLWALFAYVAESMPKSDPGILAPGDNAQLLAFILKTAGLPAGAERLPSDSAALSRIQFDTLVTKSRPTSEGVKP